MAEAELGGERERCGDGGDEEGECGGRQELEDDEDDVLRRLERRAHNLLSAEMEIGTQNDLESSSTV